jgi:NAD(P)-dependent dehydrogenase (short-subunit alcohol dehydrogenase family)
MPNSATLSLDGQRILVTGASSGIGHEIARDLHARGASVVLAARRRDRLDELAALLGDRVETCVMDVCSAESVSAAFADFGAGRPGLTGLVNSSGIAGTARLIDVSPEEFDQIIATNLRGAFLVGQAFARAALAAASGGAIVNVASTLGLKALAGVAPYAVSKAGLIHLTRCMALEWGRKAIRVNAICPGYIETDLNRDFFASDAGARLIATFPRQRLGLPDQLCALTAYLLSSEADLVNGAVVPVDDGFHLT